MDIERKKKRGEASKRKQIKRDRKRKKTMQKEKIQE